MSVQRSMLIFKLVVLVAALVGVLYLIRHLNEESVAKGFQAIGIEPAPPMKPGESRFNLCRTRVKALVWPDGRKIEQSEREMKATWMAFDSGAALGAVSSAREMNPLEVEKWLSLHCQVTVSRHERAPLEPFVDFLTLQFIDGTSMRIRRSQNWMFVIDGVESFSSPDLRAVVDEAAQLAQFPSESR